MADILHEGMRAAPGSHPAPSDCAECSSAGSVVNGFCHVCYAEPGESAGRPGAADLPPAVPAPRSRPGELRFADVLDELSSVAALAGAATDPEMLVAACRRAELMVRSLREQFASELGIVPFPDSPGQRSPEVHL